MKKYYRCAQVTRYIDWFFLGILGALLFLMPKSVSFYVGMRHMSKACGDAILIAFYLCAPLAGYCLGAMQVLLRRISVGEVFLRKNASLVRSVSWCCSAVAAITLAACFWYPPLVVVTILMLFLFLAVRVVADVLEAAAAMREEQDLTI